MKDYQGFLIDLDGTMYRGNQLIDGAKEFIDSIRAKDLPYLFLTNNSSKKPQDVSARLRRMGINAKADDIFTSSMATANYLKRKQTDASCYVIGEEGLFAAIKQNGMTVTSDAACDFVVFGIDHSITYEKYVTACLAIQHGATFVSTNNDQNIPTERGLLPGNGALTSVITFSTGRKPIVIGKPEKIIMQEALQVLGTNKKETLMVGDNYDTDIQAGITSEVDTLMVFTGVTPADAYTSLPVKPTYYVQNLREWIPNIKPHEIKF